MKINVWNLLGAQDYSPKAKKKLGIVALLYLIQGAPAAILWEVLPVYFRLHGVSLRAIGGLRLLELPYSLKFFWSPLVHRYGDRRIWILGCMLGIATILFALPFVDVAGVGWIVLLLILSLTTLSATQDVAIDSYSVGLVAREEEGVANGVRASAYRLALVMFGGGMVFLAAVLAWNQLFALAGIVFTLLGLSLLVVPRLNLPEAAREHWLKGFLGWAGTWKVIPLVLFVLTYKLGEFAIGPMVKPFWVDYGKSIWPLQEDLMFQIGLFPHNVRHRPQHPRRSPRRRFHNSLRDFSCGLVPGFTPGRLQSRLFLCRLDESRPFRTLRSVDVRISQRRPWHGGFFGFSYEYLPKRARDDSVCFSLIDFFSHRSFDRGDQRLGSRALRLRQLLCDYFFIVDARLSFAAMGEAVDSRRAAEMNRRDTTFTEYAGLVDSRLGFGQLSSKLRHVSSSRLGRTKWESAPQ